MMREGVDMKRKRERWAAQLDDVVFHPAITPFEAAVLPAIEKPAYGTLRMIRRAYDAGNARNGGSSGDYRAKIWVR